MVDVSYGEVEGHGACDSGEGRVEHSVHVGVVAVGTVVGKLSDDNACHPVEETHEAQLPDDALYLIYRLGDILNKKDCALGVGKW